MQQYPNQYPNGQMPQQQYPQQYPQQQYPQQQYPQQQQQPYGQQPMMYPQQMQQPMIQGGMVQQPVIVQVVQQANIVNFMNAYDKLMSMRGVFIKQKLDLLEVISGCDRENRYMVFGCKENGDIDKHFPLFKAKEKSDCLQRQCLSTDCRAFKMKIEHDAKDQVSSTDGMLAFTFNRECQCTCLCFNRPVMEVYFEEQGQKVKVGSVRSPFVCCDLELEVLDNNDQLKYLIQGSCCQIGIWCQCPCDPCQTVDFLVKDANGNVKSQLQKRTKGCIASAISEADNFSLIFPQDASGPDRALLMAAVIMLDFTYFEEKQQQQNLLE